MDTRITSTPRLNRHVNRSSPQGAVLAQGRLEAGVERQQRQASRSRPTAPVKKRIVKSKYDQFYTRPEEAKRLFLFAQENVDLSKALMVEPSAGEGAFFRLMPTGSLGYDPEPHFPGIVKRDFLKVTLPRGRPIAVLGNPPFGRSANTAVEHFNHAAKQPDVQVIAMIFPKSFRKAAIENRLNINFHLLRETEVAPDTFCFDGKPLAVNTVFQIWVRQTTPRELRVVETAHPDFSFTKPNVAHFVVRRVGVRAGRIHHDRKASPSSHYFIRSSAWLYRGSVERVMAQLDFASAAANATANPSLAKSEIVAIYRDHLRDLSTRSDLTIGALPPPRRHHVPNKYRRDGHRRRSEAAHSRRVHTQAEA